MKALKLLLLFSLVVVVLFGGLLATLSLVDIDHYKGQIENQVSRVLGRAFVIEGDSELRISLTPGLTLRGVRLQNADWGSRADMLYAEEAEVELAVLPLFSGQFDIKKLILLEPDVLLETNEAGRGNWEFGESVDEPEAVAEPTDADQAVSIALTFVNLKQGRLRFNDGVTRRAHDLFIENLAVKRSSDDQLVWDLVSSLNNVDIALQGSSDSLSTLLRDKPWAGRFEGNLGSIKFLLQKSVERPLAWIGLNLQAKIEAPDLNALAKLTARELPPIGPLDIVGKVMSAGALYNVELSAVAGDAKLAIAGSLAQSLDGKGLNLDVTAETPRTKSLTDLAGAHLPELGPVAIAGKLAEAGKFLELLLNAKAGDIRIDVDGQLASTLQPQGMTGKLVVTAPTLHAFSALAGRELPSVAPVNLQGSLSDAGKFFKVLLSGTVGKVEVSADTQVAHSFELEGLGGNLSVKAPNLTDFSALADAELPSLAPIKLEGSLSDLGKAFKLDLKGEAGELSLSAIGQIAKSLDGKGVDVNLFGKAPDLALVGDLAGTALPPVGPVEVKVKLTDVIDGHKLDGLLATVGKSDLSGSAEIGHQAKPIRISADLNSKLLDLVPFEVPAGPEQAAPAEVAGTMQQAKGEQAEKVFSPEPLPFDRLQQLNADISLKVDQILTAGRNYSDVQLTVMAREGRLHVAPFKARAAGGILEGDALIDASRATPTLRLDFSADQVELGKVKYLEDVLEGAITKCSIKLTGAGQSMQQIMAGLNGVVLVDVGPGEMSIKLLDAIGADVLLQLVSTLNPGKKARDTAPLVCAAVRFDIEDGIAQTRKGIALETDRTQLIGNGKIDLKTEKISLQVRAIATKGTGVGAGDLTKAMGVGGTLAKPSAALDATGLATTGATVGAAVVTGGLSYLAQKALEKVMKDPTPCKTALAGKPAAKSKANEEATEDHLSE